MWPTWSLKYLANNFFYLVSWHIWTSGPVRCNHLPTAFVLLMRTSRTWLLLLIKFMQPTHISIPDPLTHCLQKLWHPCSRLIWHMLHLNHAEAVHYYDQVFSFGCFSLSTIVPSGVPLLFPLRSLPTLLYTGSATWPVVEISLLYNLRKTRIIVTFLEL